MARFSVLFGPGGLPNGELYMTVSEQRDVLLNAGFSDVRKVAVCRYPVVEGQQSADLGCDPENREVAA